MDNQKEIPFTCPKCGLDTIEGKTVCPYCGTGYLTGASEGPNTIPTRRPAGTAAAVGYGSTRGNGGNKFVRILLVIAVLALVGILGLFTFKAFSNFMNQEKNDDGVPFTVGKTDAGGYSNKWAGVRIKTTPTFVNADSRVYNLINLTLKASYKNADDLDFHALFLSENPTHKEDVSVAMMVMTYRFEYKGLDKFRRFTTEQKKDELIKSANYTNLKQESDVTIAGEKYICFSQPEEGGLNAYLCIRLIGNRMFCIAAYGKDFAEAAKYINMVEKY